MRDRKCRETETTEELGREAQGEMRLGAGVTETETPEEITMHSFGPIPLTMNQFPSVVITIPIITDEDNEVDENFKLTIEVSAEARAANVTEGVTSMIVVLIKDDDSKAKAIYMYSLQQNISIST